MGLHAYLGHAAAMRQPVLTVFAVPSDERAAVRDWVDSTAGREVSAWLEAIEAQSPVWLDAKHHRVWCLAHR